MRLRGVCQHASCVRFGLGCPEQRVERSGPSLPYTLPSDCAVTASPGGRNHALRMCLVTILPDVLGHDPIATSRPPLPVAGGRGPGPHIPPPPPTPLQTRRGHASPRAA